MLKRAVHPGLVLKEELAEIGITPTEFARQINVPPNRVSQIINGKRAITGDTAIRFGEWFGVEPEFWLNLQTHFDLVRADQDLGKKTAVAQTYRSQSVRKGFWSYVHKDDEAERERISVLAKDMVEQYEMITGDTIELFLDKDGIAWGDEWRKKIDDNLASVEFFIPVMTPRYFKSSECRLELSKFIRRARKLGRLELLLPLYYLDVPLLNTDEPIEDDLINAVREIQWLDWRQLKFKDVNSEEYRRRVHAMAHHLAEVNKNFEKMNFDEVALVTASETGQQEDDEAPGIADRLARMEEVVGEDGLRNTLLKITDQIKNVGGVMKEGTRLIEKIEGRNAFARRLQVIRKTGFSLTNPTNELLILANQFESQLHGIDEGIRVVIEQASVEVTENPEAKKVFCELFEAINFASKSAHEALNATQGMLDAATPLEKISRDLRPVVRRLRQALTVMVEGRVVSDNWMSLIEAAGIDCREIEN